MERSVREAICDINKDSKPHVKIMQNVMRDILPVSVAFVRSLRAVARNSYYLSQILHRTKWGRYPPRLLFHIYPMGMVQIGLRNNVIETLILIL